MKQFLLVVLLSAGMVGCSKKPEPTLKFELAPSLIEAHAKGGRVVCVLLAMPPQANVLLMPDGSTYPAPGLPLDVGIAYPSGKDYRFELGDVVVGGPQDCSAVLPRIEIWKRVKPSQSARSCPKMVYVDRLFVQNVRDAAILELPQIPTPSSQCNGTQ